MLNSILQWSIAQRWLVVIGSVIITVWGFITVSQMPLDVFPEFAPPQVEIQTEAPGLAPEEVETLVTLPIESGINGTPGITTVRSASAVGLSVVQVIFNWGTDIYQARQLVTERLQQTASRLPEGVEIPQISPISSPIGTILQYAFYDMNNMDRSGDTVQTQSEAKLTVPDAIALYLQKTNHERRFAPTCDRKINLPKSF